MSAIDDLPPLREVVRAFDLAPKKQLGQNFLFDLNLTSRIARASGPLSGARVLEVGPGPGGLTRALLAGGAAHVVAIERDARCLPALAQIAARYPGRLTVVEADAAAFDPRPLLENGPGEGRPRVVANLPYNVGTQLLTGWVAGREWPPFWESLTLMFQREVAERIVATPDEREDYGRLGVLCGWRTRADILFDVAPSAFVPPPKVTSSVVRLDPRPDPAPCDVRALETVTAAAFGQRRKMLRQSLKPLGVDPAALCAAADVPPTARAEEVDVDGFVAMARAYAAARKA
ncbi:MAG: 16S rRNA (adenine(1518)-N(6)/adenine(1519)-N(6))-dimethyltransferase RsmA [Salinarimonas sp.]